MSRLSLKSLGLSILAAAFFVAFTPSAHAQEAQNQAPPPIRAGQYSTRIDAAHPPQKAPMHEKDLMAPQYAHADDPADKPATDAAAPQEPAAPADEQR